MVDAGEIELIDDNNNNNNNNNNNKHDLKSIPSISSK